MKVRLLDFHCIMNFNDVLLSCGTYVIVDEHVILFEGKDLANTVYLALINPEMMIK